MRRLISELVKTVSTERSFTCTARAKHLSREYATKCSQLGKLALCGNNVLFANNDVQRNSPRRAFHIRILIRVYDQMRVNMFHSVG